MRRCEGSPSLASPVLRTAQTSLGPVLGVIYGFQVRLETDSIIYSSQLGFTLPSRMSVMWPKLLVTLLLLAVGTPAIADLDASGCYAVQVISKSGIEQATSLRLTRKAATAPWGTNGAMRVLPKAADRKFNYSAAYWVFQKGELVITFSNNGLSGVEIRARKVEGGFRGTIENFWDFGPNTSNVRPVELKRITCTSGSQHTQFSFSQPVDSAEH